MYDSNRGGFLASIPPVTKNLIIINLIIWVAEAVSSTLATPILKYGGLHFITAADFNPAQFITYLFIHDPHSPAHVLFNMFTLWMFGSTLERVWSSKRFFIFYFVCGIGAGIVQEAVWALTYMHDFVDIIAKGNAFSHEYARQIVDSGLASSDPAALNLLAQFKNSLITIGAPGAVFGLLLGFAFIFPNQPMYLFFLPIPIKAKYMVIGYGVIEFFLGVGNVGSVAHFAHLGGLLFALIILLYWKKKGTLHGGGYY